MYMVECLFIINLQHSEITWPMASFVDSSLWDLALSLFGYFDIFKTPCGICDEVYEDVEKL